MRTLILAAALLLQIVGRSPLANGVIVGEIRSIDGTPAAGIRVSAVSVSDTAVAGGGAQMLASIAQTDSSGRFRLEDVPAGRYYIMAGPVDVASYFPGVRTEAEAQAITLTAGGVLTGIRFFLARPAGVRVSGRVTGFPAGAPAGLVRVTLLSQASGGGGSQLDTPVLTDGTFEFPKVTPGRYVARLVPATAPVPNLQLQLDDQDVNIEFSMPTVLIGRVVMDDGSKLPVAISNPAQAANSLAIQLALSLASNVSVAGAAGQDPMSLIQLRGRRTVPGATPAGRGGAVVGGQLSAMVRADGYFTVPGGAGEVQIAANPLPFGYSIKAVAVDPVTSQLRITMTTTPAPSEPPGVKVSGRIKGATPSTSGPTLVRMQTLGAQANSIGFVEQRVGETLVRDDGTFEILRVPPGASTMMIQSSTGMVLQMRIDIADRDISIDVAVNSAGSPGAPPVQGIASPASAPPFTVILP